MEKTPNFGQFRLGKTGNWGTLSEIMGAQSLTAPRLSNRFTYQVNIKKSKRDYIVIKHLAQHYIPHNQIKFRIQLGTIQAWRYACQISPSGRPEPQFKHRYT